MTKKKRIAIAYLVSFVINGVFWLVYARELRQAAANTPKPEVSAAAKLKPLILGQFKPLPPLPRKETLPPAARAARSLHGTQAKDTGTVGQLNASDSAHSTSLAGRKGQTASAAGASAQTASDQVSAVNASRAAASLSGIAGSVASKGGHILLGQSASKHDGTQSRNGGQAVLTTLGQNGKAGAAGIKMASARTKSGTLPSREDASAQETGSESRDARASRAQASAARLVPSQATALKAALPLGKDGDERDGPDSKIPEMDKAAGDKKKPIPGQKVTLKVIKMWTPKPGQKFNLATSLNIVLPPSLTLVPGPPLTPEQLEEVQKLLRQQKLKHVALNRKQLKKLIEAQRIAEDTKKPTKEKSGDEGRKREAKHEARLHTPKPRTASAHTPAPVKVAMARPRSPFTYKQWNSDMYRRWQPNATDIPAETPADPSAMNSDTPLGNSGIGTQVAGTTQRVANEGQPGQNLIPGTDNYSPDDAAVPGATNDTQAEQTPASNNPAAAAGQPGANAVTLQNNTVGGQADQAGAKGSQTAPSDHPALAPGNPATGQAGQPGAAGTPPKAGQPGGPAGANGTITAQNGQAGQPGAPPANQNGAVGASGQPVNPGTPAAEAEGGQPGASARLPQMQGNPGNNQASPPGALAGRPDNLPTSPGGQTKNPVGQPPGDKVGQPGPQDQPSAVDGQPAKLGNMAGQPRAAAGASNPPPANPGNPGNPGAIAGQPGQPGQTGGMTDQPGAKAGQPSPQGMASQPGPAGQQPSAMAGQPGATAGPPGANAGQPGAVVGQTALPSGQPGAMAGQTGQTTAQGQPGAQPGAAPAQAGQPSDAGAQVASASLDSAAAPGTPGTAASGGVLSGEQNDGMSDTPDDTQIAAQNTDITGFDTSENHSYPDLPSDPVGGDKKGIPGALILPPSPPMGTETGKDPTPHPVKRNILTRATGKTAMLISPVTQVTPTSRAVPPRKAVPLPVGMIKKSNAKPIPPALTVGSTSARGTVLFVVMPRPHLALGTVTGLIDPPLPPAKGTPHARTLALRQEPLRALAAEQTLPPAQSAPPTESIKKTPPIVRQVKNSQGIKEGTEQPLPPTPLPDSDMEIGDGSGLKGDYYQGRRFDLFQFTKADPNINFVFTDLPDRSPSPKIPSGSDYTIRWTGKIAAKYSETYTLYATADDGVRVWINHKLIIDDWTLHSATEFSHRFTFKAGEQYPIKVEYLESAGGAALVRLYWSSPSQPKQYIPEDAFFYPLPGDEEDLKKDKAPL